MAYPPIEDYVINILFRSVEQMEHTVETRLVVDTNVSKRLRPTHKMRTSMAVVEDSPMRIDAVCF
jgi:hypothetical protein